jgi:hypothetical protein
MISWKGTTIKDFRRLNTLSPRLALPESDHFSLFWFIFVSDCYQIVTSQVQQTRSDTKRNAVFSIKNGFHFTRFFVKQADQTACYRILLNV